VKLVKYLAFLGIALISLCGSSPATAGILTDHTKVWIKNVPGSPSANFGVERSGTNSALLVYEAESVGPTGMQYTYAWAQTNASASGLIRLETHAIDEARGTFTQAEARANAVWSDIITYQGDSRPDYLTLTFQVSGVLDASQYSQAGITATIGSNLTLNVRGAYDNRLLDYHVLISGGVLSIGDGFTDLTFDPETGAFSGKMIYQAHYDRNYGGYAWKLTVSSGSLAGYIANSGANPGWAYTQFGHTISLESLSLPDGTILSDSDIAFDSGLTLASVPEPSSLIAAGSAAMILAGAALCKRRAA